MNTEKISKKIETGNSLTEGQLDNRRGWFVGSFISPERPLVTNSNVEIKWAFHPKGEKRTSEAEDNQTTSITMLVKGNVHLRFEKNEVIELAKNGDYAMWQPNMYHELEAIEDSEVITVRWPSKETSGA